MLSSTLKQSLEESRVEITRKEREDEWAQFLKSAEANMKLAAKQGFFHFNFNYQENADKAKAMFIEIGFNCSQEQLRNKLHQVTPKW